MKSLSAPAVPDRSPLRKAADDHWRERAGRLFGEFERPAKAMVRRAFRGAFGPDELDDIYASAWVGTLRALASREGQLGDDEIRSYVLTAVANQAGKELRRRRRKPTAPLELVGGVADQAQAPDELAANAESSRLTRDLLASLPPRRRAVMMLRYGWGLDPSEVCRLVTGLSPRAYRKEVTRGIDELTEKMRAVERGEWCADREPVLKAFVAGTADTDQERQARAHLAHCRACSGFVARLGGHLHDLGSSAIVTGAALEGLGRHTGLGDRLLAIGDRVRDVAGGVLGKSGSGDLGETASQLAASGGARGAGTAGAGLFAQLTAAGTAGKIVLACVGGGLAATACVAAGVGPLGLGGSDGERTPEHHAAAKLPEREALPAPQPIDVEVLPSQVGNEQAPPPPSGGSDGNAGVSASSAEPARETTESVVADSTPAVEQEFGVAAAAAPPASTPSSPASGSAGSSGGGSGEGSAVQQEFGP